MTHRVARLFIRKKWSLAVAESCTGGLITHSLTNIPGSSRYLRGGLIAYANDLKQNILHVDPRTIRRHGAVSQETAIEMAIGVRRLTRSHVGLAVTGIAGPGGGTPTKPVGTVFIACSADRHVYFKKFHFTGSRRTVKDKTQRAALAFLLECLS
jgi:PncC family amidohydrolase